jgi:tetratricopeptide (TPR) repeat protein
MEWLRRSWTEEPGERARSLTRALNLFAGPLRASPPNVQTDHAAIEAHLSLGAVQLRAGDPANAEREFVGAAALAKQALDQDPEELQDRRELAVALRRLALIPALRGQLAQSDALRREAAETLRPPRGTLEREPAERPADSACPETIERFSDTQFPTGLGRGDLVIGNGRASAPGQLLVFSPEKRELSVLAEGAYLADIADVAYASRTELYVVDRALAGQGGVVRLQFKAGRWRQKPVTCSGLLRRPAAVSYFNNRLLVADADEQSARLIAVDLVTGRQSVLGRMAAFSTPGKMVHGSAGDTYVSLYWPAEGGAAEIVRYDAGTRRFTVESRYGLLDDPVALAITPQDALIAGDRGWVANRGRGDLIRIGRGGVQTMVCENAELSRVTALTAATERKAWYVTAASSFAPATLVEVDLANGHLEQIMSGGLLAAPRALAYIY